MTTPGAEPITTIISGVSAVLGSLTAPAGSNPAQVVEQLTGLTMTSSFPLFLLVPRTQTRLAAVSGFRAYRYEIDIMELFAGGVFEYASAEQRLWVPVVLNALDQALKLAVSASPTVQTASVENINYDPVIIDTIPFTGITFKCVATTGESFNFNA